MSLLARAVSDPIDRSGTIHQRCWWRLFLVFLCLGLPLAPSTSLGQIANQRKARSAPFDNPAIIEFKGEINWRQAQYFRSRLQAARRAGIDLLVIEIDSPGGLKTESLDIAETLRDIDWAFTVAYVPRRALSGAALITLGCDEVIVGPNAIVGDIGVIAYDPVLFAFRFAPAKIQSVLIRQARDLAESKGRSPELAESMIDKDVVTWRRPRPGGFEFKNTRVDDPEPPQPPWEKIDESGPEKFLAVNGPRAVELGLADAIAPDRDSLAERYEVSLKDVQVFRPSASDAIVYYLNHPLGTGVLILIGLIAFFFELSAPGIGIGGLVATLCATLFFWSHFLGGTAGWLEIILFAVGLFFLAMELLVIPGWGLPGLLGLGLLVSSIFLASQDFLLPHSARQWDQFLTMLTVLGTSVVGFIIVAVFITRRMGSIPVLNQLILAPPSGAGPENPRKKTGSAKPEPVVHPHVSVGDWGLAESPLRPGGRAIFDGRSHGVVSDGRYVSVGEQIKVIQIQGSRIVVTTVEEDPPS